MEGIDAIVDVFTRLGEANCSKAKDVGNHYPGSGVE